MNKRVFIIIGLILLSVFLISCTGGLSEKELYTMILEKNADINSYTFTGTAEFTMFMESEEGNMEMDTTMEMSGALDREAKLMESVNKMSIKSDVMNFDMDVIMYVQDDVVYMNSMGLWMKVPYEESMWDEQDQLEQTMALIESGSLEILKDEGGYHVAKITPDLQTLVETALSQQEDAIDLDEVIDFNDIIEDFSITVWINKKTFIIEKTQVDVSMNMDSGDEGKISIVSSSTTELSNINTPVRIEIPQEALQAQDLSDVMSGLPV